MPHRSSEKPVIYHPNYTFLWSFGKYDRKKSKNVRNYLMKKGVMKAHQFIQPEKINKETLLLGHSEDYLQSIRSKYVLSRIFQSKVLPYLPNFVGRRAFLEPILYHTSGTVRAAQESLKHGWAINLGGGGHHASYSDGQGFCLISDIAVSINHLRQSNEDVKKVMIIDLDAHQGNGHERDYMNDEDVFTIDFYTHNGEEFYPNDTEVMHAIDIEEKLKPFTPEDEYLDKLFNALTKAQEAFKPDIIYYIAGTDIFEEDSRGLQSMSASGIIKRDEMVFDFALKQKTPVVMVFAGGYHKSNAAVIADSIENLDQKFEIINTLS